MRLVSWPVTPFGCANKEINHRTIMRHDVDSLAALEATLTWYGMRRRARQWLVTLPALAVVIALVCLSDFHQTTPKLHPTVFLGPWMLKAQGT
jgi:hypothetical protein